MMIDCTYATEQGRVDVSNARTLSVFITPASAEASTAVVEVVRAFDADPGSPTVSFATVQNPDLDGSAILDIDVTDAAFVAFVVTTAEAGVLLEVGYKTSGRMSGWFGSARGVSLDKATEIQNIGVPDDGYKSFLIARGTATTSTAVVRLDRGIGSGARTSPLSPSATLTVDGATVTGAVVEAADRLALVTTTADAGESMDLWWYTIGSGERYEH